MVLGQSYGGMNYQQQQQQHHHHQQQQQRHQHHPHPQQQHRHQPPLKRMKVEDDSNSIANRAFSAMLEGLAGDGAEFKTQTEKDEEVQSLLQDIGQCPSISDDKLWDGEQSTSDPPNEH